MSSSARPFRILFEPWGLGDALIAASVSRHAQGSLALACDPRWHPLIRAVLGPSSTLTLLGATVAYTRRGRGRRELDFKADPAPTLPAGTALEVLSVRGDFRDARVAKLAYPGARLRVSGWMGFLARRIAVINLPWKTRLLRVTNRYDAWADLLDVPRSVIHSNRTASQKGTVAIGIHVGAQWRSRQYPHVAALKSALEQKGLNVRVFAGPGDTLPAGISEAERPDAEALIAALRDCAKVITNDSGPMHLAALAGADVTVIALISDIAEWIPPGVNAVIAPSMPSGYRPSPLYTTDTESPGWPSAAEVADHLAQTLVMS